jgi:hypothetical protein
MALGIKVEHSVPYVHTQNGLAESLIKRIKLIARPFLLNSNLPTTCWGHAVLHAATLLQIRHTAYNVVIPYIIFTWTRTKYFPSAKIWMCCIHPNTTTSAYVNGTS